MFFGYNTNGFAHHRLEDALAVLAGLGYEGVALTLDHHALNPFDPHLFEQLHRVRDLLRAYRLRAVVETGARFLLDARRKHQPTLLDPDPLMREYRREFIRRWKDVLWNVHIEDMRRGVHEHLMFGEGEIDFGEVLRSLHENSYQGGVYVELSRHSHDAFETARKALAFLTAVR